MFKLKYDDFLIRHEDGTYEMPADQRVRDEAEKNKWKSTGFTILKDWRLYLMLVPMLLVYLLWKYLPLYELVAVFKTGNQVLVSERIWCGLENFKHIFYAGGADSRLFWMAFRNTFILSFYGLLFGFPFPIILALFFNEVKSNIARSVMQVCVYLPKFLSTIVVTSLALALFTPKGADGQVGVVSRLLVTLCPWSERLKFEADRGLLYSLSYFRALYLVTELWEHAGYGSIVFFAAVISVSPTSYEAAQIDGANKMAQMRYVVIPGILSTVVIMLIMKIGSLLSVGYEKLYLLCPSMTGDYPSYQAATVVSTLSNWWSSNEKATYTTQAYGLAAEMTNNLIGMILVIGANKISTKAADVSLY